MEKECGTCGSKFNESKCVINFNPMCDECQRAQSLQWQIFHIVGQDGAISSHYKLIIHPEVFEKFRLIPEFSDKPGKYNQTHIYKKDNNYGIKLQQTFFGDTIEDKKHIFHIVDVVLDKNIFWWYMKKYKNDN